MSDSQEKLWQEQARRLGGDDLVATIEAMARDLHDIKKNVNDLAATAFPGGDIEGHRRYHQVMIERNLEIRRLRVAIQEKTISGLIWAFIVFLGLCVFSYVTGKNPPLPPGMLGR